MSTPLPPINLAGATVGTTGTIDLTRCAPSTNSAFTNQVATLQMYNESGCGLRLTGVNSGLGVDLPAGGWNNIALSYGESALQYVVMYVLPNAAVNLLLATYYAPNEPIQAGPAAALGNSPVNIGNSVPLSATATAVANDGNPSGTEFVEASISGTKHISVQNQGLIESLPTLGGVDFNAFEVAPTDASAKFWALVAQAVGSGAGFYLLDVTDNKVPWLAKTDGSIQFAGFLVTIDANGVGNFTRTLSGSTQTFINIAPSDSATSWQYQEATSGDHIILSGSEVARWKSAGGSGLELSGVGGVMRAWSHFTGGATGNYNHNLGTTPNVVLCMQSTSGSETLGWDTPTGTQVHITNPTGNTWVGLALLMA